MANLLKLFAFLIASFVATPTVQAAELAGEIGEMIGVIQVQRGNANAWQQVRFGDPLFAGDLIHTQAGAKAKVIFRDQSVITIGPNTKFRIDESVFRTAPTAERTSMFTIISGKARAVVSSWFTNLSQNRFEIRTPSAVAGVRGTEFVVSVDADGNSEVVVLDGVVEVYNRRDKQRRAVFLGAGMGTKVSANKTPSTPQRLDDQQMKKVGDDTDINQEESSLNDDNDNSLLGNDNDKDDGKPVNDTDRKDNDEDDANKSKEDTNEFSSNEFNSNDNFGNFNEDLGMDRGSIPNQDVQRTTNVRINVDFR